MLTEDEGAWTTRRRVERGILPALITTHACAIAAGAPTGTPPSAPQVAIDITGQLTGEGIECPAMRGDDGQLYTLVGSVGSWGIGARVRVSGERLDLSYCQQGITIRIKSIQQAK